MRVASSSMVWAATLALTLVAPKVIVGQPMETGDGPPLVSSSLSSSSLSGHGPSRLRGQEEEPSTTQRSQSRVLETSSVAAAAAATTRDLVTAQKVPLKAIMKCRDKKGKDQKGVGAMMMMMMRCTTTKAPVRSTTMRPKSPTSRPALTTKKPVPPPRHIPTQVPSSIPSHSPQPSVQPSSLPSTKPSSKPSRWPSTKPSLIPSRRPSTVPSQAPSAVICTTTKLFPTNGHRYLLGPFGNSFSPAGNYIASLPPCCGGKRAHFATIANANENAFAAQLLIDGGANAGYIGYNDFNLEMQFEWITGELDNYTNWSPGEPGGDIVEPTDCVVMQTSGLWFDLFCRLGFNANRAIIEYDCDLNE